VRGAARDEDAGSERLPFVAYCVHSASSMPSVTDLTIHVLGAARLLALAAALLLAIRLSVSALIE